MKRLKHILAVVLLLSSQVYAEAQQKKDSTGPVQVVSRMIDGKPVIKIIPRNVSTWFNGMRNGYEIALSEYSEGEFGPFRVLAPDLRPAPEEDFLAENLPAEYAEPLRRYIYEDTFSPEDNSFEAVVDASEGMKLKHYFFVLLSSYDPRLSKMSGLQLALPANVSKLFKIRVKVKGTQENFEQKMLLSGFYTQLNAPQWELKPGDKSVDLLWKHANYKELFVAYRPEKSVNGKDFEPIGPPIIFSPGTPEGKRGEILVRDSLGTNYTPYWYRLAGYDLFGHLSAYTEPVKVSGRDLTPPPKPKQIGVKEQPGGVVQITWMAESTEDLKGFQVFAAPAEKSQYQPLHQKLLDPSARSFDYKFANQPLLYYRVASVDTAGNAAASTLGYLTVYDSIPPLVPAKIEAKTDTNYVVTINWQPSSSPDVKGYRLYKAFSPAHGFVPARATILTDTSYTDTLTVNRLEKKVYYRVVAVDHHYNHSEQSDIISAPIPDKIPPTPPLLIELSATDTQRVSLAWNRSSSADVAFQTIYRRLPEDSISQRITDVSAMDSVFTENQNYGAAAYVEYYLTATDSSGNVSDISNGKRLVRNALIPNSRVILKSPMQQNGSVELTWNYPAENYRVFIYRAGNEGGFHLIGQTGNQRVYTDRNVAKNTTYRYKVTALEANGYRSPISNTVEISIE